MSWKVKVWVAIIASGILAIYLILSGITEVSISKLITGCICGFISLFWLCVEGAGK